MVTLTSLDEVTTRVMRQQWQEGRRSANTTGTGPNTSEALEVQLALRHQLGAELNLPFPVNNPIYSTGIAQLNDADKAFAVQYVNNVINDKDQLTDALVAQPIWRLYLESILAEQISVIKGNYVQHQNALEEQNRNGTIDANNYLQNTNKLMAERQEEIDTLLKKKTAEMLAYPSKRQRTSY